MPDTHEPLVIDCVVDGYEAAESAKAAGTGGHRCALAGNRWLAASERLLQADSDFRGGRSPLLTRWRRDQAARILHAEARPNADRRDGGDRVLC
jgi:hypothetical protein